MPAFRVELAGQALRSLDKLPPSQQEEALDQLLRELESNPLPRPPLIRKLSGTRGTIFRVRLTVGKQPWKAFYRVEAGKVIVIAMVSKQEAQRVIRRLP